MKFQLDTKGPQYGGGYIWLGLMLHRKHDEVTHW